VSPLSTNGRAKCGGRLGDMREVVRGSAKWSKVFSEAPQRRSWMRVGDRSEREVLVDDMRC
jgi:hypothetical protein